MDNFDLTKLILEKTLEGTTAVYNRLRGGYNENRFAYHVNGGKYIDEDHEKETKGFHETLEKALPGETKIQDDRARAQAHAFREHAAAKGYDGVHSVHLTAKPGAIKKATGLEISQQDNPSDVIVKFKKAPEGASHKALGVSLKSSAKAKIGFHNGGAGTMGRQLGVDLEGIAKEHHDRFAAEHRLPASAVKRKEAIKGSKELYEKANKAASTLHTAMRDALHEKYSSMSQKALKDHFTNTFLKAKNNDEALPYVKVHGQGGGTKEAKSHVEETHDNPVYHMIKGAKNITVEKKGDSYIHVKADGKKAFGVQVKHNSTPMATSLKVNGQP
jgi:hypothetical protein